MLAPHFGELALMLDGASTETEVSAALERWSKALEADADIEGALYRANVKTNLAGQLFVTDVELKRARVSLKKGAGPTFLNLRFDEAINAFASRQLVSPEEFEALLDSERFRAFSMKLAIRDRIVERAQSHILAALEPDGPGLLPFIAELRGGVDASGFPGGVRNYLETVYRTSTATSYGAGRFRAQVAEGSDGSLVWEYLTAGDNRVRPEHRALDGKQWIVGDAEGRRVYPPNGYQCRCSVRVIEREDANTTALERTIDADDAITDGFNGDPAGAIQDQS